MGAKIVPTYATLNQAYLEENLYEIKGKKYGNDIKEEFTKSWKRYLFRWLLHILEMSTGDINELHTPTLRNKIYYGTHLKRTTIFRHPYKKRKKPNHHIYLPKTTDT